MDAVRRVKKSRTLAEHVLAIESALVAGDASQPVEIDGAQWSKLVRLAKAEASGEPPGLITDMPPPRGL